VPGGDVRAGGWVSVQVRLPQGVQGHGGLKNGDLICQKGMTWMYDVGEPGKI